MYDRDTTTYIIETKDKLYYCGKTNNIEKRLEEHRKENSYQWFGKGKRREFSLVISIKGNFEKEIKRFGVKKFYIMSKTLNRCPDHV